MRERFSFADSTTDPPAIREFLLQEGRLYHRADLGSALSLSPAATTAATDHELAWQAWQKWGPECVHHLRGDWIFAVWNRSTRRLFLAQAAFGNTALYYHCTPHAILVGSSLKELLSLPEVPRRPNFLRVAQVVTSWGTDGTSTGYEGIFRLPPAHTLTAQDGKVTTQRYWFPENLPPLILRSDEEYTEAFLTVYDRAVLARLEGGRSVGGTLSGGLDSGSVCALAARELKRHGQRLPVFASVPLHKVEYGRPRSFHDESPFVEANRAHLGNVDVHYIRAAEVSPLTGVRRLIELLNEPSHAAGNFYWLAAIFASAQAMGLGVLLTGQHGNGSVSYVGHPSNAWRNLVTGRWGLLARNLPRTQAELWPALKRHWLVPPLHAWRMWRKRQQPINPEAWQSYSALRPEFGASLRLTERMREAGHDPRFILGDRRADRLATLRLGYGVVGAIWSAVGKGYDIEARDPTSDEAVVEFCLRVPEEQYCVRGQYRSLIRRAMKGLLPDKVRLNEMRGKQGEDLAYRIRATKGEWVEALAGLEQSPLAREALDLPRMRRLLDSLDAGITREKTDQCGMVLTRGMMAGEFLRRFD
jgi:asparagine synthase (glutamine-hydrolysing)